MRKADCILKHLNDSIETIILYRISEDINGIRREDPYFDDNSKLVIKALIHKVVLSSPAGEFSKYINETRIRMWVDAIIKMWGHFHPDEHFRPSERRPGYTEKWIKQLKDFLIIIFTNPNPTALYLPRFIIEIHTRESVTVKKMKDFLRQIGVSLGDWRVSSVDYTIDLYCYGPREAKNLFWILRRYLYIPYQRKARTYGENMAAWGDKTRMSTAYRASGVKIYERGPDNKKTKGHWSSDDLDRVRLEYTARRPILLKNDISTVRDLIEHPRFYDINNDRYKFRCFVQSDKLPHHWEDYTIEDENGNVGCFQLELNHYRKEIKNIAQYVADVEPFDALKKELMNVSAEFDDEWTNS
ncbi:MAG: hypothetical protein NTV99_11045 [Deltaproteobacteria bacterium]|nr:hypothetical protein [Deltaproteobacteria bacterium]